MLYITYATSPKKRTGYKITFTQFEEGNLLLEYHNGMESGDKSDDDSNLPPLSSETKMDKISSSNEYDSKTMPTDMLEDIGDRSQSHTSINRRESGYKICDCIEKGDINGRDCYYQRKTWSKVNTNLLKLL